LAPRVVLKEGQAIKKKESPISNKHKEKIQR
jgi:hypothetical protein